MIHYFENREQWLQARKLYIGGSDASCIIGKNKWRNNVQLWEEKTGRRTPDDISGNEAVKIGIESEPYLRELFKINNPNLIVEYEEFNMWTNEKYPYAHASLDGWSNDNGRLGILEIKTAQIQNRHQHDNWFHKIPEYYYCQIVHYMAVTEAEYADLYAQLNIKYYDTTYYLSVAELIQYHFERSEIESDIEYLMEKEKAFAEAIRTDQRPAMILV